VVAHGPDEFVLIEQIEATARTLVAAALDICGAG
jgi:acetylornithine deacetylase/succinyl-diaminopimelate desuccinylase-like protein